MPDRPPTLDRFDAVPSRRPRPRTPSEAAPDRPLSGEPDHHHDPFPRWLRIVLYFAGWLLLLLGFAALFLPGPGLLGLALGAAVLSLASEALHARLREFLLRVWPQGAEHLDHFRHRVEAVLSRFLKR